MKQQPELPHTDPPTELVTEFVANTELADRLRSLELECGVRVLSMDVGRTGYWLHISRPVRNQLLKESLEFAVSKNT